MTLLAVTFVTSLELRAVSLTLAVTDIAPERHLNHEGRAIIFEDEAVIRFALWKFFDDRGYEIFTFPERIPC